MYMRALYVILCGLVLAGIIHISIILLIPTVGTKDASDQLSQNYQPWEFVTLSESNTTIADVDPFFRIGACRFDLADAPLLVSGPPTDAFWSASIFDEDGQILYSLNKRTAIGSRLSMLVVNPVQMSNLRELQPQEMETSIIVEARNNKGFMVLRILSPDETWGPSTVNFLQGVSCSRFASS